MQDRAQKSLVIAPICARLRWDQKAFTSFTFHWYVLSIDSPILNCHASLFLLLLFLSQKINLHLVNGDGVNEVSEGKMGRKPCCDKHGVKRGAWTPEEDEILIDYINKNGQGKWRSLPKHAGFSFFFFLFKDFRLESRPSSSSYCSYLFR